MQLIQRPLPTPASSTPVSHPTPIGLYARWEMIDGKLTCIWLKYPD